MISSCNSATNIKPFSLVGSLARLIRVMTMFLSCRSPVSTSKGSPVNIKLMRNDSVVLDRVSLLPDRKPAARPATVATYGLSVKLLNPPARKSVICVRNGLLLTAPVIVHLIGLMMR